MHSFSKERESNLQLRCKRDREKKKKNVGRALLAFRANSVDMQIDWLWKCNVQTALRFSFFFPSLCKRRRTIILHKEWKETFSLKYKRSNMKVKIIVTSPGTRKKKNKKEKTFFYLRKLFD